MKTRSECGGLPIIFQKLETSHRQLMTSFFGCTNGSRACDLPARNAQGQAVETGIYFFDEMKLKARKDEVKRVVHLICNVDDLMFLE